MHLDVQPNSNSPDAVNCLFAEAGPSRRVYAVPVEHHGQDVWACVVGWDALEQKPVEAWVTLVMDSADGHATLIHGGSGGIRLRKLESSEPWGIAAADQWGEPFLLLRSGIRTVSWEEAHPGAESVDSSRDKR
ncbi:MAG: hypothetical protein H6686_01890 [Fibrobacteria bacterium]|nr:hypothetical protein [Fibrobacteria bacterium]